MSTKTKAAAAVEKVDEPVVEAAPRDVAAEALAAQANHDAIMDSPEAEGREVMAKMLADAKMNSEMAIKLLAAAPAPKVAAPVRVTAEAVAVATSVPVVGPAPKLPIEKIDKSRPYGAVYGEAPHQIAYTQRSLGIEGWPYDAHGGLIEAALTAAQKAKLEEKRTRAVKAAAAPVPPEPDDDEDIEEDAPPARGDDESDETNLEMWLKGEAKYKPHQLQKAILKRFHAQMPDKPKAALYLIETKKLLPRSQCSAEIQAMLPPLK